MMKFFIVCALIALFKEALTYPKGAPTSACLSMTPKHGEHLPQSSASPVEIVVTQTQVRPGDSVTVQIESIDPTFQFKGFMIQARRADATNEAVGTMAVADKNSKVIDCNGPTTITHIDRELKNSATVIWTAPEMNGNVQFQ